MPFSARDFIPAPGLRRQFEPREVEAGRDGAADESPIAECLRRLPRVSGHHRLRAFAGDEIARCVVFLASDDAGLFTGSTLSANGGQYFA